MQDYFTLANFLLGLGLICTLVGTILTGIESGRQQSDYANKLQRSTDEIIRLSNFNSSLITGGDAFPDADAFFDGGYSTGLISIVIRNSSQTPLYDLKVQITDQQIIETELPKLVVQGKVGNLDFLRHHVNIGTLSPNQGAAPLTTKYDVGLSHLRFSIESSARNGNFRQIIELFKIDDNWLRATRIYRPTNGEVKYLRDDIDPRIPKELLGTVN